MTKTVTGSDPVIPLAAVTDEFSPTDLEAALRAMADLA